MGNTKVLIVDDDNNFLNIYSKILKRKKYTVDVADSAEKALEYIAKYDVDIVVTDMYMPGRNGIELIKSIKEFSPNIEIILITGNGSVDNAIDAMKAGAFTYIQKPINTDELLVSLNKIEEIFIMRNENRYLKDELLNLDESFIGTGDNIIELKKTIKKVAKSDSSILITGESGTGKELVAKAIHAESDRRSNCLVKVNCSALSEGLLESELFGHEKGSFTGAISNKVGRFEIANNGTLFLDEIGEISLNIQVKLLRVLQEKEFERVGGNKTIKTNFRLIAATNKNLLEEIKNGRFREDLFYRLNVIPIITPPLRDRKNDISLLIDYFSEFYSKEMNKNKIKLTKEAMETLINYNWPGNIRELKNIIERMTVLSGNVEVGKKDILKYLMIDKIDEHEDCLKNDLKPFKESKQQFEIEYIQKVLKMNSYNITKTAQFMGIARKNLQLKLKTYKINKISNQ